MALSQKLTQDNKFLFILGIPCIEIIESLGDAKYRPWTNLS
jgi:hypothetical protein